MGGGARDHARLRGGRGGPCPARQGTREGDDAAGPRADRRDREGGRGVGKNPDEIRREIEDTRARMGDTVDALGYKADVKSRAKDSITEKKERVVESVTNVKDRVVDSIAGAAGSVGDS